MKAQQMYDLAARGEKIQSIKHLREWSGLGLKEAKDVIEEALSTGDLKGILRALGQMAETKIILKVTAHVSVGHNTLATVVLDGEKLVLSNALGTGIVFDADALDGMIDALTQVRNVRTPQYIGPMAR